MRIWVFITAQGFAVSQEKIPSWAKPSESLSVCPFLHHDIFSPCTTRYTLSDVGPLNQKISAVSSQEQQNQQNRHSSAWGSGGQIAAFSTGNLLVAIVEQPGFVFRCSFSIPKKCPMVIGSAGFGQTPGKGLEAGADSRWLLAWYSPGPGMVNCQ